ncbi:hypothetical protein ACPXCS_06090 [Streptomyces sp. DT190]|uniref:hypothetical protein n=1 Tax=unclassified Streptomyces TaxID=2593676 RepID=UPI003CF16DA6
MVMALLLAFAVLVALWWVVAIVANELIGRRIRIPYRWAARLVPGWLPPYVHRDRLQAVTDRVRATRARIPHAKEST